MRFIREPVLIVHAILRKYAAKDSDGAVLRHGGKAVYLTQKAAAAACRELLDKAGYKGHVYECSKCDPGHFHLTSMPRSADGPSVVSSMGDFQNTSLADGLQRFMRPDEGGS